LRHGNVVDPGRAFLRRHLLKRGEQVQIS